MGATAAAPLRVGIDFHTWDGIYQGSRSHLLGLYREAVRLAPEIRFVFLVGDPDRLAAEEPAFARPNVERVALRPASGLARLGWQLALAQRRQRLDLLHVQYRLPFVPLGACACTIHDVLFESHPQFFTPGFTRMARWTSRVAVRRAALLFAVSGHTRDALAHHYGVDPSRVTITPNGVDPSRFRPGTDGTAALRRLGLTSGGYLCSVGRLEPRKNHVGLIEAYARLPSPRPPLLLVGQRDFACEPVFETRRRLGLADDVHVLEHVRDDELPALMRHAMAIAYPSHAEGFGMPVIEAMASGVPVLTSSTTALQEVAGGAALTVDPSSVDDIERGLRLLVGDAGLRSRLAEAGLARAAHYGWRASAQALVGAYRRHALQLGRHAASTRTSPASSTSSSTTP